MARADVTFDLIHIGSRFHFLCVTRAFALAVGSNKANITLADSGSELSGSLDEALSITTTDLALEHWACHMAGLARIWLLALTPGAVGYFFFVFDTSATISTTTG
jgi:hypothetical protein